MDWQGLGSKIAGAAPALGAALAGPGGMAIGSLVASALGTANEPDAIDRALESDPEAAYKLRELQANHKAELEKLVIADQRNAREQHTARLGETQKTMRAELAADDGFKSGWRPMIGYTMAFVFGINGVALAIGLIYSVMNDPAQVSELLSALMVLAAAMAPVLGVNIARRSADKQTAMTGQTQNTLMQGLADRLSGTHKARGGA